MVPVGEAQVGCTVTLATGVTGGPSAGVIVRLVGNEMQIGSKVRRKADGMIGVIVAMREVGDLLERHPKAGVANGGWIKPETRKILHVKWKRGGIDMNVQDVDVDFI